ncbi:MAG: DUF3088 family protein [Gammaproteobacteria bacterium]
MTKDQLFLLKPDFRDGDQGPWYCPSCATLEGVLSFYPRLRGLVDVQYLEFPRPRAAVIAAIGAENQGLPVLVVASERGSDPGADAALAGLDTHEAQGRRFLQSPSDIGRYLARRHGIGEPH